MTKPSDLALEIYKSDHRLKAISVSYTWVDDRSSTTYVTVTTLGGLKKKMVDSTFRSLFDISLDYNSCAELHSDIVNQCIEWIKNEKTNKRDHSEYKRLKKKLGL